MGKVVESDLEWPGLEGGTLAGVTEAVFSGSRVILLSGEGTVADHKCGSWSGCVCARPKSRGMGDSVRR